MAFIKQELDEAEDAIESTNYEQYSRFIDVNEFVNFLLVQELSYNTDAYRYSLKLYKSPRSNGLYKVVPWDFDYSYGNHRDDDLSCHDRWQYQLPRTYTDTLEYPVFWWRQLMNDTVFEQIVKKQYLYMREHEYSEENINSVIDSLQNLLTRGQAIDRNTRAWNSYEDCRGFSRKGESFVEEVDYLKQWITHRLYYMDMALTGRSLEKSAKNKIE